MLGLRRRIGRWLRTIHFDDRVAHFAKTQHFWQRWESAPELLDCPAGQRILVLAPHMDDESIGCGGTIHKCVSAGKTVQVVYMTDGRFGDDRLANASAQEREVIQNELIVTRKREAQQACTILGTQPPIFLDAIDAHLQVEPQLVTRLSELLEQLRPDTVFVPFPLEDHPDHRQTPALLAAALEQTRLEPHCFCYEVWTPLLPNCLIDITDSMPVKRAALQAHSSQLKGIDYVRAMEALSMYRAMRIRRDGYGEAFWQASTARFLTLQSKLNPYAPDA